MEILKRDVDGFSSFIIDFFSYLIFLSESSLIKINVREKSRMDNLEKQTTLNIRLRTKIAKSKTQHRILNQ
jgi:hypothetical protein